MEPNGIGTGITHAVAPWEARAGDAGLPETDDAEEQQQDAAVEAQSAEAVEGTEGAEPAGQTEEEAEAKGVVGLLLAGHFKGVADVRLRINFHDELMAAEAQAVAPAVAEGAADLAEDIGSELAQIAGSEGVTEEQAEQLAELPEDFAADVEAAVAEFEASGSSDTAALFADLQAAFDAVMQRVREILGTEETDGSDESEQAAPLESEAPAEEAPPEPTDLVAEEPTDPLAGEMAEPVVEEPVLDLEAIEQSLTDVFGAAVGDLTTSVETASVLPPLSPPTGNGVAYQKFLAIYNEMVNGAPPDPPPAEEAGVVTDVVV
jgi:hypothetical protein